MLTTPGFEYGYPDSDQRAWYGLWNPNCDCFVWVHHDLERIKVIQMLLSSKAVTCLLSLDPELYKTNAIDNECCEHWTVEDIDFSFNEIYKNYTRIPVCKIVQKKEIDPEVHSLQQWILFINQWLQRTDGMVNRFSDFLSGVLDIPQHGSSINDVYKILLLENSQLNAEQKLTAVINQCS